MKIFSSEQIHEIDANTIRYEPVSSIDLMERAAGQVFRWIADNISRSVRIIIFAGPGNNGGDGIALARMLAINDFNTEIFYVRFSEHNSDDWKTNLQRLEARTSLKLNVITRPEEFPEVHPDDVIIDAILGSGLTRIVEGLAGEVIKLINNAGAKIISIDIPSGLFGEDNSNNLIDNIIKADQTLSFQFPKLAFMFPENEIFTGKWEVLPIGLNDAAIRNTSSLYSYLENSDVSRLLKKRKKFDHKGIYGHGLLVAGSWGKMGSVTLAAQAALRTGIGLLTCHIPVSGRVITQTSVHEAMVQTDRNENYISEVRNADQFDAIGIGPGLGTMTETQQAFYNLINRIEKPIVIDADALNILSMNSEWKPLLKPGSILTPHPKEFERLAGKTSNSYERLEKQIMLSGDLKCIVVLKGAHTSITTPDGKVMFNSTGNPGMATAGSGDVLTGIILSLLAQGYSSEESAMTGVYLHGLAGDIAAENESYESILASDIINNIGKAFNRIRELNP